jgi:site-specific DNA-methyltransferase (adenine-specific)
LYFENQFFHADEYLFWMKTPSTKNYTKACGRFVEMILVKRYGKTFNRLHWSQMTGVYDDRLIYPPVHPFQKPVSLMERLVRIYTNPGDVVLDPFMGSGTTGVACANTGRGFVGVEIDKEVFDIAQKNIEEVLK